MTLSEHRSLLDRAFRVKRRFLDMYRAAGAGHIGCSLSCADLLVFLRFRWMEARDTLVLSKGHAAGALYAVLAEAGTLGEDDIGTFYHDGTRLPAHPPAAQFPDIPFATGSLGHGLPLSAGMALGARLTDRPRRFFCVTSDGELDEGSVWEAALFLSHHRLSSVTWLIDRNGIQGIDRTENVLRLEPLEAKLRAFGFFVTEADGHDQLSLERARQACSTSPDARTRPAAVICHTVKGHGVSFMADTVAGHYLPMTDDQHRRAIEEITAAHRAAITEVDRAR